MMEFGNTSPHFVNYADADGGEGSTPDPEVAEPNPEAEEEEEGLLDEGLEEDKESEDSELLPEE